MQLASDLRPWRLHDFYWGASGDGLILVLSQAGSDKRVLAWLDLRARSVAPLTPDLDGDARYVSQTAGSKPQVLIAVRQSPAAASRLVAVTPTGALISEWDPPAGHATRWLATGTQAVAVCTDSGRCTWWHTKLDQPSWSPIAAIPAADGQASRPVAFSSDGQTLFALSSADRDTVALIKMSAAEWSPEVVYERERFDVTAVLMAPDGTGPELVTTTDAGARQSALTSDGAADLATLAEIAGGARATITGSNGSTCLAEVSFQWVGRRLSRSVAVGEQSSVQAPSGAGARSAARQLAASPWPGSPVWPGSECSRVRRSATGPGMACSSPAT